MSPFLEAAMLGAFSISWYCSIWKMLRMRQATGKSLGFVLLICFGYVCGIGSKVALYQETGVWSLLVLLYIWNLLVTGFDAYLVMKFSRRAIANDRLHADLRSAQPAVGAGWRSSRATPAVQTPGTLPAVSLRRSGPASDHVP